MRSLDECRKEIFRRSGEKIRQRKKRRVRTLVLCVPLLICAVAAAAFAFPGMMMSPPMDSGTADGAFMEGNTGMVSAWKTAEIHTKERCVTLDDADAAALENTMEEYFGDISVQEESRICTEDVPGADELFFRIVLSGDGRRAEFVLRENTLTEKNTGREVTLNEKQLRDLLARLEDFTE